MSEDATQATHGIGPSKPETIGDDIDLFIRHIDSLADTLPIALHVIHAVNHSSERDYESFLEQECAVIDDKTQEKSYQVESRKC